MGRISDAKMGADYVRSPNGWGKLQTASDDVLRKPIPTPPERYPRRRNRYRAGKRPRPVESTPCGRSSGQPPVVVEREGDGAL